MKTHTHGKRANAIIIVLMSVMVISAILGGAIGLTATVSRNVCRTNTHRDAIALGDGVVDYMFAHWREKNRPTPNVHLKGEDLAALPMPGASLFPGLPGFTASRAADTTKTVSNLKIQAVDSNWSPITDSSSAVPIHGMSLGTVSYYYLVTADISLPNKFGPPARTKVRRVLEKQILSPWNYAIFYADRLEIHPGPPFAVTGWVHTNERLYTGHNSLTFQSRVTYTDDWYIGFAPGDGSHDGDTPAMPNHAANLPPALGQAQQPFGLDSTRIFSTADTNPNNDSYRELVERPTAGFADPISEARYYNQSDVRLIVSGASTPTLVIKDATDTTCLATSTGLKKDLYDVFTNAVALGQKLQDNREAKEMRLVTLDVSIINTALRPGGLLYNKGFKGVIYATDTSYTTSARRAVRLKNGGVLPPGGLTIATDNPLYIQGDYNTGTVGATKPASNNNGGDPTQNTVAGYTKQPCAILADAVMILSNAWTDANSYNSLTSRVASNTTINCAIVAGIVPSGISNNNYSGGAENFPRFMESWSNINFTYWGSLVQLFSSKQNTGTWGKANVYNPPNRRWYFDPLFYTDPPPGSLTLVSYNKGKWYLE